MNVHQNNKSISLLEKEEVKMELAGRKERWAIRNLVAILNCNDKYIYEYYPTLEDKKIGFEGRIYIKNKLTDKILDYYIVEAKVRSENIKFDTLQYEVKKHNTLYKQKQRDLKDGTVFNPKILYIQFVVEGTYLFFIDDIMNAGKMPKRETRKCKEVTVADNNKYVPKQSFYLHKDLAVFKDYKFNELEYANYLLDSATQQTTEAKTIINKYYSLF